MMRLPRSMQGRLLSLVMATVVLVWLTSGLITWFDVRHELDELLDGHLAQAAALLVVQQARELEKGEDDDEDRRVDAPSLHRYAPKATFQVWHEGRLVLRSSNAPSRPMSPLGRGFKTGFRTLEIDGIAWRVFAAYGAERDVQVYVGEQVGSRVAILWAVLRSTLWPVAAALPLLALAVWWAVRQGMKPLRRLGSTLAARDPRALDPVPLEGVPSEMAPMLDALNGLFARIGELMESERRFTADAAHELRTPIAAIRAQAQVALGETDDALRRRALNATLDGCDRAVHLVEQLLTLSRLEAGADSAQQRVDLRAVARDVVAALAGGAIDKRQELELDADEPCIVRGNEALLGVLMRNLVDNAIRYSPPGARVKVALRPQPEQVVLTVEDSGPGLADEDRARLGQRFFRVLGSEQSGSGLGWSIVERIAAAQRAELRVGRSVTLAGLAVEVRWPRFPDRA